MKNDVTMKNVVSMKNRTMDRRGGLFKVLLLVLLILIIGLAAGAVKINSMVGEQLRLTMSPEYLESKSVGTEPKTFEVDVKLYNKFVCEASCNYTLTDISHNNVIDRGSFSSKTFKNEHYSKDLPMNYNGYGTNLYLYRLECVNNYTALCPANRDVVIRKSLLVLTYEPSAEQLSAKSYLEKNYLKISSDYVNASKNVILAKNILDAMNFSFDTQKYYLLENSVRSLNEDINAMMGSWINDDYVSAMSLADGSDMTVRSGSLVSESLSYNAYLRQTITNHNTILGYITQNYYILNVYKNLLVISPDLSGLNASESASILNFILRSGSTINTLNTENYNYGLLYNDTMELGAAINDLNVMIFNHTKKSIMDGYTSLFVYSNILCANDKNSNLCEVNITANILNYVSSASNISEVPNQFQELCAVASEINSGIDASHSTSYTSYNTSENSSLDSSVNNASLNILLLEYKFLLEYESMLVNKNISNVNNVKLSSYKSYVQNSLRQNYNITNPGAELITRQSSNSSDLFSGENLILNSNSPMILDISSIEHACGSKSDMALPSLTVITAKYLTIPQFDEPSIKVPKAPVAVKKCCIYDMCQPCEAHTTQNPLVLLHGHSFNQGVDAYRSIEIFDGFEYALSGENFYFLTGLLVDGNNASRGILGRYVVPAISKPTYYLETYNDLLGLNVKESKDANIDTYALRLKESIDYTLYITGSDKVDIVAHSMGGLVVRRYIQIFGTKDVDKIILVGTPNQGIDERTYNLCKLFGASAECEDMRSDSLFMSKLNDPANQPNVSNMYLVVGRGCDTEGVDGDGVVTVESVLVKNVPEDHILYVDRGTEGCSVTNVFHQDLIRMNKYPQVYTFIKSKLGVEE
jgi:pimeloyl-ACP methyl ester carboxylesterase